MHVWYSVDVDSRLTWTQGGALRLGGGLNEWLFYSRMDGPCDWSNEATKTHLGQVTG